MQMNFNHADTSNDDCGSDHDPCGDCGTCKEYQAFCALPDPGPVLKWNLHFREQARLAVG